MNDALRQQASRWLSARFKRPASPTVSLLRAYTNGAYLIETEEERFVLKLSGASWRTDAEIRYEIDLLNHRASRGVRVALPISGASVKCFSSLGPRISDIETCRLSASRRVARPTVFARNTCGKLLMYTGYAGLPDVNLVIEPRCPGQTI